MSKSDKRPRLTDEDYAEMAADYAANPITADEIISIEINPAYLRAGRPAKGTAKTGRTPVMTIRLPEQLRTEIAGRIDAGECSSISELIRVALVEYFDNHPAAS